MKQIVYTGMLLFALTMGACTEDYTNWADPQTNPQEDPSAALTATFAAGADAAAIDMNTISTDSVEILKLSSWSAPEGSTLVFKSLKINDSYAIPYAFFPDNTVKVAVADLSALTEQIYNSRASVARTLTLTPLATAILPDGAATLLSNVPAVDITLTPVSTPELDPNGYYIVGDFNEWGAANALGFTQDANDPTRYTLETEFTKEKTYFKIFPAAALAGGSVNWDLQWGSEVDGDDSGSGFIVWSNAQALLYGQPGKVKITLDLTNFRFTVQDNSAPVELFMTGSAYGWGSTWVPLTPVNGAKGAFWGLFYFAENDEFKFAPQAAWSGGDFGYTGTVFSQESIDRAGIVESGGNIKTTKAGWYLVYVLAVGNSHTIEFYAPDVYIFGDTNGGTWDVSNDWTLTVPTDGTGEFVSPALAADGEVRICVKLPDYDWWKTEFIILNGKIAYRGNGGDQERVRATAGQKVYLNFTTGDGRIE
ncbi:MAG: DUF5115 domain-containing protein [Mediterranea sp.]|jgi:hypothetical protein|nr:DUF5115 domain-containing protein [Mediterranea sp.]